MAIYASMVVTLADQFYKSDGHTMQIYFFTAHIKHVNWYRGLFRFREESKKFKNPFLKVIGLAMDVCSTALKINQVTIYMKYFDLHAIN